MGNIKHTLLLNWIRQAAILFMTMWGEKKETLPTVMSYWFAWFAFHPDADVYTF